MSNEGQIPAALAIDSLGADARGAFEIASDAGYRAIAFASRHAELAPDRLDQSGRRHLKTILAGKHLSIDSLRAGLPMRGGLTDPATIDRALESARKTMLLARDLGVSTVTLNVGALSQSKMPQSTLVSAVRELAQQADAAGLTLALGADAIEPLQALLKFVDYDRAKVDLDTARLIAADEDPLQASGNLAGMIAQLTAADAIRAGNSVRAAVLGEGQMPLRELLEALHEQGYSGPLVVDPRELSDPEAAARHAAEVLRRLLQR